MKSAVCVLLFVSAIALGQSNPVPFINQPLVPTSTAPGGPAFVLTEKGTGFDSDAVNVKGTGLSRTVPNTPGDAGYSSGLIQRQHSQVVAGYGKLPLIFEVNQGQTDPQVKFLARGPGYTLFLTSGEAVWALHKASAPKKDFVAVKTQPPGDAKSAVIRMRLRGANPAAEVSGLDELPGKSNYFIGNDPTKWRHNVPTYAKVRYGRIYSGVDLVYYGNQRQLEYDFIVAPGADPHRIQFEVRGAKKISPSEDGDLVVQIDDGEIRWHKPTAMPC
jgi:hypothetical protein